MTQVVGTPFGAQSMAFIMYSEERVEADPGSMSEADKRGCRVVIQGDQSGFYSVTDLFQLGLRETLRYRGVALYSLAAPDASGAPCIRGAASAHNFPFGLKHTPTSLHSVG